MNKVKKITYAALLTALAILIPIQFSFLRIQIGPFTATLAAHVPLFLSILFGPWVAAAVGLGSTLGFLFTAPAVVAARASSHIIVGIVGGFLIKKNVSFNKAVLITIPIHGIIEALAVIPFGFTLYKILIAVGIGTVLHHTADWIITCILLKSLVKSGITKYAQSL